MKGNEEFLEEDWEREALKDEIFVKEFQSERERAFWAWYMEEEGHVKIEHSDGSIEEFEKSTNEYFLPF